MSDFAACNPDLVTRLVLLDAPLPDHEFSDEVIDNWEQEERLLEAGDLAAAVELNLDFWCPGVADRVRPMAAGALELEIDAPEAIDLGAVQAPTAVAVGEQE